MLYKIIHQKPICFLQKMKAAKLKGTSSLDYFNVSIQLSIYPIYLEINILLQDIFQSYSLINISIFLLFFPNSYIYIYLTIYPILQTFLNISILSYSHISVSIYYPIPFPNPINLSIYLSIYLPRNEHLVYITSRPISKEFQISYLNSPV